MTNSHWLIFSPEKFSIFLQQFWIPADDRGTWDPNYTVSTASLASSGGRVKVAGHRWIGRSGVAIADESMVTTMAYPPVACDHHCPARHPDWGLWPWSPSSHIPLLPSSYSNSKQLGNNKVRTGMAAGKHYLRKWFCAMDRLKMGLEPCVTRSQRKGKAMELSPCSLLDWQRILKCLDDETSA